MAIVKMVELKILSDFYLFIGTLAEKALLAVLPPEEDFRYTVRINSEVMASDGSTSMATVCGGILFLCDLFNNTFLI